MSVTWILERKVVAEACFDEMLAHLRERQLPHHTVRVVPFVHEVEGKVPDVHGPVVVYGSIGVQKLAEKHGWKPGVFTNAAFSTRSYKVLGDLFLNADAICMPMSAVSTWLTSYAGDAFFIRPEGDSKEFAGTVMGKQAFSEWHARMLSIGYLDGNDFGVAVSRPKELGCEWRVIVVDGTIVTSSLYRQYGIVKAERHILPDVEAVVRAAHDRFAPAPAYAIDVAQAGDAFKVIEYNTLNSAGFYDCDVRAVIDAVTELVQRTWPPEPA
jgi:hypothetical protein